ncbi:deoxyribonuclease II (macronuclear) [Tetrahymena thermophila SB210]|uniref:Deoxyribonuclease II n=1 Tax=Tetrahymena thermophila (strain SB210) TaxID=312017 RepID=Q22N06_TETTS|nr:deoxyribonuclease II [Tetrahymena thermophila SB210]EAR86534.2 deoxyribonuclease II [Tetrahymena thermophila SB210]|eukprot:XP_976864.2 deoxyribonuclease II [Tetrahymena thermophila SB210]
MKLLLQILITLQLLVFIVYADPQCLNQQGKKVDWFIALKLPSGAEYAYCDSENCQTLKIQSQPLDDVDSSPLLKTLKQIEQVKSEEYSTLFWNDQPPTQSASSTYAHAKGVMGIGSEQGFLIVHSTPKFPEIQNGKIVLGIKSNQQIYGQHYFCISTTNPQLDKIASAYNVDYPFVYDGFVSKMHSQFPYFTRMLKNIRDVEKDQDTVNFKTLKGVSMIKFSKSGKWAVPFYDKVAATNLKTNLFVESWGSPQEEPECSQGSFSVYSNLYIDFQQSGIQYKWTKDHSKYAISSDSSKPYVCLGDINRQTSQWKRGGGTVCFQNQQVYNNFKKIMVQQQDCSS